MVKDVTDIFAALARPREGKLFVISGPSGAGKTTVCARLLERVEGLVFSVSYTTRPKRAREVNGKDYHFISESEFKELHRQGAFAEEATVHGYRYGTEKKFLDDSTREGLDVLLDIDVQGADRLGKVYGARAVKIFVVPPSFDALTERLKRRNTDAAEAVALRIKNAKNEILRFADFKYYIVNDELEKAVAAAEHIVGAERLLIPAAGDGRKL